MAKRKRSTVRGKVVFAPRPEPPQPGHWKAMERFGELVCQWAWTCAECKTTEYILNNPPKAMDGEQHEHCPNRKCLSRRPPWYRQRIEAEVARNDGR